MENWTDDYGLKLAVHERNSCTGSCSIHSPSMHGMRKFKRLWRPDRALMERICPHGVGHPDPDDIEFKRRTKGSKFAETEFVHGCDGCCL